MNAQQQVLEQYLREKFRDKPTLSITRLEKITDGWESDNYLLTVEYGRAPQARENWVWRMYSGVGDRAKAAREFTSMKRLRAVGYPVPRVHLLEADHSPFERPFILMEYIPGAVMWDLLGSSSAERRMQLMDQFCRFFVQLHALDWKLFDDSLPDDDPFFFIDRWLSQARAMLQNFPEVDGDPFLDWVTARRDLLACARPSPTHQDFHPGNILFNTDHQMFAIDWTSFAITDFRFDLGWTLMLAQAYGWPEARNQILNGYQRHAEKQVEQIEVFEAIECVRRLLDLTVSLTYGAQRMGMNAQATETIRASMEAHRRVYKLFVERTGLQIEAFDKLFGTEE